jgi:hypothetical protein
VSSSTTSARRLAPRAAAVLVWVPTILTVLFGPTHAALAQVRPDSVAAPDSATVADSLAQQDSLAAAQQDTLSADTIFYNLPTLRPEVTEGWATGVWGWSHAEIMASGAVTLAELMADVPGVVPLLTGDYGTPLGVTAFGVGGGRIRVIRDGFEVIPLGGGTADLSRIGLAGIEKVRFERHLTELRIHLESRVHDDARPYSLIEAGTGDLATNVLRGAFTNPNALGGSVGLGLERFDSRGARGDEAGNRSGSWLRYQLHRGDGAGLAVDFRRAGTENQADPYAAKTGRTDWTVRGRARLSEAVTAEAYWGRSTHSVDDERPEYALEGGRRSQAGVRATYHKDNAYVAGALRRFGGDALPGTRIDVSAGMVGASLGGVAAELDRASWAGSTASARRVRAWTRPLLGLSLFASAESGAYGARTGPLEGEPPLPDSAEAPPPDTVDTEPGPLFRMTDRSARRIGVQWAFRDLLVSGAFLELEADSLLPVGFEADRGEPPLTGGKRSGWEVWGRVPLPLPWEGFRLEGSLQQWDEPWSYLPRRIYSGALIFHRTFLESGNFELDWRIGVRGRDPMTVRQVLTPGEPGTGDTPPVEPELASVPFYQNWYTRLQMRIVSVRIFLAWENFTLRPDLQDFPDRLLPRTRAVYGLRWTMWN